ncbi:MAG: FGGY-family carbohydrate kinase [Anaerolineae bacterium]|jgi:xylulokinase
MHLLGVDVGTGGARAVVCDPQGEVIAHAEEAFPSEPHHALPSGWFEQHPSGWWTATKRCLRHVIHRIRQDSIEAEAIAGLSITSTSGTACVLDDRGEVLRPALMYSDSRASAEAEEANLVGAALTEKLGYRFSSSFALPKLLWLARHEPERFRRASHFLSPTDFIIGRLSGRFGFTDYTNALKMGYDLIDGRWPEFIESDLGIPREPLPRVVAPGAEVGQVCVQAAEQTGLAVGTPILAGMTDGCASQVSTGAVAPGQWASTLGTTLVVKGVTADLVRDPLGRIYCHRHPDGHWMPGGASNTGGECIARRFSAGNLDRLNAGALDRAPTSLIVYPLVQRGERFPFVKPDAEGFLVGRPADDAELYAAHLEGVAYVERLGYTVLKELGAEIGDELHAAGGATNSRAWLQLRADILGKALLVARTSGGALGAAVIAAGSTVYDGLVRAARAMARISTRVEPRPSLQTPYDERFARFCAICTDRGYLE